MTNWDHMRSLSTRDLHVPSWHPIQASPSQDMWELPSNGTTSSFLEPSDDQGVSFPIEEQRLQHEQGVSSFDMESSLNMVVPTEARNNERDGARRSVLGDATNTLQRQNGSPATIRMLRRSHFS
ncbi:hypothetical protein IV203_030095 [Nitzschia inconspicua]|uniref:Uncharacterized protein n=1 Tax=Nitzschia inconspicua TaxID=303405 RepID=A0A9K3Q3Y0_9STRA|nr:hypothetical protein IV203_030095 [Nitzschia inconspicua]